MLAMKGKDIYLYIFILFFGTNEHEQSGPAGDRPVKMLLSPGKTTPRGGLPPLFYRHAIIKQQEMKSDEKKKDFQETLRLGSKDPGSRPAYVVFTGKSILLRREPVRAGRAVSGSSFERGDKAVRGNSSDRGVKTDLRSEWNESERGDKAVRRNGSGSLRTAIRRSPGSHRLPPVGDALLRPPIRL